MSVFPAMSEKEPSTSSRPRPKVSSSIKDIQSAFLAKKEKREGEEEEGEGEKEDQHQHHRRKHHHHHHGKRHAAKSELTQQVEISLVVGFFMPSVIPGILLVTFFPHVTHSFA